MNNDTPLVLVEAKPRGRLIMLLAEGAKMDDAHFVPQVILAYWSQYFTRLWTSPYSDSDTDEIEFHTTSSIIHRFVKWLWT